MFGGCASLIWVGDLFGALNVNGIVVFGVWCLFGKNILHGIGNLW